MEMYVSGEIDRVELIYHHFKSMGVQILLRETYLPIDPVSYTHLDVYKRQGCTCPDIKLVAYATILSLV